MTGRNNDLGGDPWDGVVFDESFVKAGRHEPPARTRESIARYGGQRTSWRQGALLEPVPVKRRTRRSRRHWQLAAAVVAVVALGWFSIGRISPAPEIPALAAPSAGPAIVDPATAGTVMTPPLPAEPQSPTLEGAGVSVAPAQPVQAARPSTPTDTTEVSGVSEFDAVGTCYLDPLTGGGRVQLTEVDCTAEHNRELASHRTATDSVAYPDAHYWHEVVGAACEADLSAYIGTPISGWPPGLSPSWVYPRQDSWAFGDRHVYCMFRSDEPVTTSVLHGHAHA